jgi:hypothetical protein
MIPREILKKIRQIELRTNRIVTETPAGLSFQPSPQFGGALIFLPDGHDFHQMFFFKNRKVNRIWPTDDFCPVSGRRGFSVAKRIGNYLPKIIVKHHGEASANSRLAQFIPIARCAHLFADVSLDDEAESHFFTPYRANISARKVSHGMPRSGCARASAARRSSSAICSGVSWGSKSSRSCSKTSYCSSNGNSRIFSKTCVALMALNLTDVKHFASA